MVKVRGVANNRGAALWDEVRRLRASRTHKDKTRTQKRRQAFWGPSEQPAASACCRAAALRPPPAPAHFHFRHPHRPCPTRVPQPRPPPCPEPPSQFSPSAIQPNLPIVGFFSRIFVCCLNFRDTLSLILSLSSSFHPTIQPANQPASYLPLPQLHAATS